MTRDAEGPFGLSGHAAGEPGSPTALRPLTVVVLGMHRSGTSVTARLVRDLGWSLGNDGSLLGPRADNLDGFFERADIQVLNDRIFEHLGASWDAPPSVDELHTHADPGWLADIEKLLTVVAEEASEAPFAIKDPRLCVLWELWAPALPDNLITVVPVRDPVEVARSLHARDDLPLQMGLALWETYMLRVARARAGKQVVIVRYDRLLQRPQESVLLLASALGAGEPLAGTWASVRTDFRKSRGQHEDHRLLTPSQVQLWEWIASLPDGSQTLPKPEFPLTTSTSAEDLLRDHRRKVQAVRRADAAEAQFRLASEEHAAVLDRVGALDRDLQTTTAELESMREVLAGAARRAERAEVERLQERDHLMASLGIARNEANAVAARLQEAEAALHGLRVEHKRALALIEGRDIALEALRGERDQALDLVEMLRCRRLAQVEVARELERRHGLELERSERVAQLLSDERDSLERSVQEGATAVATAHARARVLEFQRDNLAASLVLVEGQRRALELGLQEITGSRVWRFGRWITGPMRALKVRLRWKHKERRERA